MNPIKLLNSKDIVGESVLKNYMDFALCDKTYRNNLVKYIVLMYDSASELIKSYPILATRKSEALKLSGFTEIDFNTFELSIDGELILTSKEVESIKKLSFRNILDMVVTYRKSINPSRVWDMIFTNEQVFDEYQRILLKPITGDEDKDIISAAEKKEKLMNQSETINERLKKLYKEAYGDDEVVEKVAQKKLTPEAISNV